MIEFQEQSLEDYTIRLLDLKDAMQVQQLLEDCIEFQLLVEGIPVPPEAGKEIFTDVPPGKTPQDKLVLGLFDRNGRLSGVVDLIPCYPDEKTWWIGLQLLAPDTRGKGIGREWSEKIIQLAHDNQAESVMLGVVEENKDGFQFWNSIGFKRVRTTEPRTFGQKTQKVNVMQYLI